jgi:hypothetical protein
MRSGNRNRPLEPVDIKTDPEGYWCDPYWGCYTVDMGTIHIEWGNVTKLTAPEFFEVEDMEGGLYFGSLRPGPAEGALEVVSDWGASALPLRRVARIQRVKSSFWDRFKGSVDAGARGSSPTAAGSSPRRLSSRTASSGTTCAASVLGGWAYTLARTPRNELVGGAGLALNREKPVEGESTTNVELASGFEWANFAYDFPNTDIQVGAMAYLGLNQWGRFRLEANASLRRELFSDFYFGLNGYESYDSEPATEGAQKNDWGLTLTLGYSF